MTVGKSGKISKSDLEQVMNTLVGLKYGLLSLSIQVEESISAVKRVVEATDVPQTSLPAEGSLPT
jgi:hypothetical protein